LKFFGHLEIKGLDNLKNLSPGLIFASNHSSEADPIILPASLPFLSRFSPIFYVSRPKSFYNNSGWRQFFYGGFFFKLWGAHSAISGKRDYGIALSPHAQILSKRKSLLIFPEGRKTRNGDIMYDEAHGGVIFLAEKMNIPIVPVRIKGAFKMSFKNFLLRKYHITIIFGKPIYVDSIFESIQSDNRGRNPYKVASRRLLEIIGEM
jgi:1-acyl-sn-glycerol-3-phosphate acyltransferase